MITDRKGRMMSRIRARDTRVFWKLERVEKLRVRVSNAKTNGVQKITRGPTPGTVPRTFAEKPKIRFCGFSARHPWDGGGGVTVNMLAKMCVRLKPAGADGSL